MSVKVCRWCHGSLMYEVFELKTKESPLGKRELYLHQQYLWEESRYGELPEDPKERQEFLEKEKKRSGIVRTGVKADGIVFTINEIRKKFPNETWRQAIKQSYGAHCHICHRRFTKEYTELTQKLEDMKGRKDMVAVGEISIKLDELWRRV